MVVPGGSNGLNRYIADGLVFVRLPMISKNSVDCSWYESGDKGQLTLLKVYNPFLAMRNVQMLHIHLGTVLQVSISFKTSVPSAVSLIPKRGEKRTGSKEKYGQVINVIRLFEWK